MVKARLAGRKSSGGKIELFIERALDEREALALIKASHPPAPGSEVFIGKVAVKVEAREGELYRVRFSQDIHGVLERFGAVPLPPYIRHAPQAEDAERYQTVYAKVPGAVAAPTAGLHFDDGDAEEARAQRARRLPRSRCMSASARSSRFASTRSKLTACTGSAIAFHPRSCKSLSGKRMLAVGTTSLRALEAAALTGQLEGETDLFITPGFEFRVVKRLLTNFHLPKSTLLMLACAFGGKDQVLRAYSHAIAERYRFFSYGDAMLIER